MPFPAPPYNYMNILSLPPPGTLYNIPDGMPVGRPPNLDKNNYDANNVAAILNALQRGDTYRTAKP